MKRLFAVILLAILCAASFVSAHAQRMTPEEYSRQSSKAAKKQQKMLKKANKKQLKAMKKYQKAEQKATKKANRDLQRRRTR